MVVFCICLPFNVFSIVFSFPTSSSFCWSHLVTDQQSVLYSLMCQSALCPLNGSRKGVYSMSAASFVYSEKGEGLVE